MASHHVGDRLRDERKSQDRTGQARPGQDDMINWSTVKLQSDTSTDTGHNRAQTNRS